MKPLIKWLGNKRKLLPQLLPLLPSLEKLAYIEPFFGSGALFFGWGHAAPVAILGDSNAELMNVYSCLAKEQPHAFTCKELEALAALHRARPEQTYKATRERFNAKLGSPSARAAMFLYLNRTCFNGVWRVNKKGEFNVPQGDYKNPVIYQPEVLKKGGALLRSSRAQVTCADYARLVHDAMEVHRGNVFVYLDPPYVPLSETANFTGYTTAGFGHEDFGRLRTLCKFIDRSGGQFMLSNSNTPVVREAFKAFHRTEVRRAGTMNSDITKRAAVTELVIRNYL